MNDGSVCSFLIMYWEYTASTTGKGKRSNQNSVAFCSPAKSLTFSSLIENPLVDKKLKFLHPLAKCTNQKAAKKE